MSTSLSKRYNNLLKDGMDRYQHAVEAKSPQNIIKHAQASISTLIQAMDLAKVVNMEQRIPYINEYLVLNNTLIGSALFEEKDLVGAIEQYKKSLELNKKTLNNQETHIRRLFIWQKLMSIARVQENIRLAEDFAENIFFVVKTKLKDIARSLEYLNLIKDIFIQSKNLDMINKTYALLLRRCKKATQPELRKAKADTYRNYAKYATLVLQKKRVGTKYFHRAKNLYTELSASDEIALMEQELSQDLGLKK